MSGKPFKPMLAGTPASDNDIHFPVLASPKLDGVRAIVKHDGSGTHLLTRSLKDIPNRYVNKLLALPLFHGLDGELTVGPANDKNVMQTTMSGVMSHEKTPDFQFHVFDYWPSQDSFDARLGKARDVVAHIQKNWALVRVTERMDSGVVLPEECPIVMVPHKVFNNLHELEIYEAAMLEDGWEGVMIRDPAGLYKYGRSTVREGGLLKLKRFLDAEAIIVGFVEEMQNNNAKTVNELGRSKRSTHAAGKAGKGTLGAFICRQLRVSEYGLLETFGPEFNIGTGINDALAAEVWANKAVYADRIVKFKHFPHGVVDAPRHPVFLGFRDKRDL